MFHGRKVTDRRDKIYALLGMSSDNFTSISANYKTTWDNVLRQVISNFVSDQVSVGTHGDDEVIDIQGRGDIVGEVIFVRRVSGEHQEEVVVAWKTPPASLRTPRTCRLNLQIGARSVEPGDLVYALRGGKYPSIVRPSRGGHWLVIRIAASFPQKEIPQAILAAAPPCRLALVWDWKGGSQTWDYDKYLFSDSSGCQSNPGELNRLLAEAAVLKDIRAQLKHLDVHEHQMDNIQKTMRVLEKALAHTTSSPWPSPRIAIDTLLHIHERWTILCIAVARGRQAIVKLLLDADCFQGNFNFDIPIWLASAFGQSEIKSLLFRWEKKEVPASADRFHLSFKRKVSKLPNCLVARLVLESGAKYLELRSIIGDMPVEDATRAGQRAVVKLLLDAGFSPDGIHGRNLSTIFDAESPLSEVEKRPLWLASQHGFEDIVELLITRGCDPEATPWPSNQTALTIAVINGHVPVVKLLLQAGARLESADSQGITPLGHATARVRMAVFDLLLENGADGRGKPDCKPPLLIAAYQSHEEAVEKLLASAQFEGKVLERGHFSGSKAGAQSRRRSVASRALETG